MSLFKGKEIKQFKKDLRIFENRLDAADTDRRRIKANTDKQGGQIVDLECKLNKLLEGKSNAGKHRK